MVPELRTAATSWPVCSPRTGRQWGEAEAKRDTGREIRYWLRPWREEKSAALKRPAVLPAFQAWRAGQDRKREKGENYARIKKREPPSHPSFKVWQTKQPLPAPAPVVPATISV